MAGPRRLVSPYEKIVTEGDEEVASRNGKWVLPEIAVSILNSIKLRLMLKVMSGKSPV